MGIIENIFEKGKQIAQGIKKTIAKVKSIIKFFMTTLRSDCWNNNTSSSYCSFACCVSESYGTFSR